MTPQPCLTASKKSTPNIYTKKKITTPGNSCLSTICLQLSTALGIDAAALPAQTLPHAVPQQFGGRLINIKIDVENLWNSP
jgi:hypothetical protein